MGKLAVVIGDAGSAACLIPVILELLCMQELEVQVYADPDGVGVKILRLSNIPFTPCTEISEVTKYDLLVCGTSVKAQTLFLSATRSAVDQGVHVVWVGDFYRSGCDNNALGLTPDSLTVIDQFAQQMVMQSRPELASIQVPILGNPAFDELAQLAIDKEQVATRVLHQLGLTDQKLVVFSASSSKQFDGAEMTQTITGIRDAARDFDFRWIPRFHPDDPMKEELRGYMAKEARVLPEARFQDISPLELYAAADAVVVHYSTEGIRASMLVPTLFAMFKKMRQYWRNDMGGDWPFFPQIGCGLAEVAWDSREIAPAIERMLNGEPDYYSHQRQQRSNFATLSDGMSCQRHVDFILGLLE